MSNPKKWKALSEENRVLVVRKYYDIRDADYQNISFLLRDHAEIRRQIFLLFTGVAIGVLANPISAIMMKYLPADSLTDDLRTLVIFGPLLVLLIVATNRASAESLDDENVIDLLLEIARSELPSDSQSPTNPEKEA